MVINVPLTTVFVQGIISFLSPCVIPLLPLYIGYLSGGGKTTNSDGKIVYPRVKTFINTLFFVIGISVTFFILGFGFSTLGSFFNSNRTLFAKISGIIMIVFGLYQLGVFGKINAFSKERRIGFDINKWAMGPIPAFLLGFTFSFAWTPCIGPVLSGVLLMASTSGSALQASMLIGVYCLGFVIPFLILGLFTTSALNLFAKYKNIVKYTVKIGAVILIIMGLMTATGTMNGFTKYLSIEKSTQKTQNNTQESKNTNNNLDFSLKDQNGNIHNLSDYKGKVVFLNFWATWCPPCREEMPDIQKTYEELGLNKNDVAIIGVAAPNLGNEGDKAHISEFLSENGYNFPVLMDNDHSIFRKFNISAFPTTFIIDKNGEVYGYTSGALTKQMMKDIINQAK